MKNKIIDFIKDDDLNVNDFSIEIHPPSIERMPGPGINRMTIRETEYFEVNMRINVSIEKAEVIARIIRN